MENTSSPSVIQSKVSSILSNVGFEIHPFKIGWYNAQVQEAFTLPYNDDTLAFIVISTPKMFELAFKPFILQKSLEGVKDPIDECMIHHFKLVKQAFPEEDVDVMHDFEMNPSRRPKILVQTAGHVAGAAYYYQRADVEEDPWGEKKIFGVSVHPKYGGWFALRGVVIFKNILHPSLPRKQPPDIVSKREQRIELLERYNFRWRNWSFRDIVPVISKYSEEQKKYFETSPKDRKELITKMIEQELD